MLPAAADLPGFFHQDLGLADGGDIDEAAIERDGALAFLLSLRHGVEDALSLLDLGFAGAEHLVGQCDLARMDRPFAFAAQHRSATRLRAEAVRILKIAEGTVDRAQP